MRTRTKIISVVLATLIVGTVAADAVAEIGRDVASEGRLTDISGSLAYHDNEWFLHAPDGRYEVHMGPFGHDGALAFTEGASVDMRGFVIPEHIAPVTVTIDDHVYEFWHEERYPLWAGTGERQNAVDEHSADRDDSQGLGRGLAMAQEEAREDFEPQYRNQDQRPGRGRRP